MIEIKNLPQLPGVYLMKDQNDQIIYIGKAKNIQKRVSSYFNKKLQSVKTKHLMKNLKNIDYIVTINEVESLILESHLIKEKKPKYNFMLKDSKSYPFIKVTVQEVYPRVIKTRKNIKDGNQYFGPYPNVGAIDKNLKLIHELFPIRSCDYDLPSKKVNVCLDYHIQNCQGCCIHKISSEEYKKYIEQVILFLRGRYQQLIRQLIFNMNEASKDLKYELAGKIKRQIESIKQLQEKQRMYSTEEEDVDVIGYFEREKSIFLGFFWIREGKMQGKRVLTSQKLMDIENLDKKEILSQSLRDYYANDYTNPQDIPDEILLPFEPQDQDLIKDFLKKLKNKNIEITIPKKGKKKEWVNFAVENTKFSYIAEKKITSKELVLNDLKKVLKLQKEPRWIEGFDISNTQGEECVGGMVSFYNGKANKKGYRHFKIKTVQGINDVGSLQEMIGRRYQKLKNDQKLGFPDLILVDGGRGQVNGAQKILDLLDLKIPLIGLAKKDEIIYFPDQKEPLKLKKHFEGLQLLQEIRDEVHRFCNSHHKKLRNQKLFQSILQEIEGIGQIRQKELLKHFQSLENIKKANVEELSSIERMNSKIALKVYNFFH